MSIRMHHYRLRASLLAPSNLAFLYRPYGVLIPPRAGVRNQAQRPNILRLRSQSRFSVRNFRSSPRSWFLIIAVEKIRIVAFTGRTDDSEHPADVLEIIHADPSLRNAEQQQRLANYFRDVSRSYSPLRSRVEHLKERLAVLTQKHSILVMNESKTPRKTHILERGVYSSPLEEVQPGTPTFLPLQNLPRLALISPNGLSVVITHSQRALLSIDSGRLPLAVASAHRRQTSDLKGYGPRIQNYLIGSLCISWKADGM